MLFAGIFKHRGSVGMLALWNARCFQNHWSITVTRLMGVRIECPKNMGMDKHLYKGCTASPCQDLQNSHWALQPSICPTMLSLSYLPLQQLRPERIIFFGRRQDCNSGCGVARFSAAHCRPLAEPYSVHSSASPGHWKQLVGNPSRYLCEIRPR